MLWKSACFLTIYVETETDRNKPTEMRRETKSERVTERKKQREARKDAQGYREKGTPTERE